VLSLGAVVGPLAAGHPHGFTPVQLPLQGDLEGPRRVKDVDQDVSALPAVRNLVSPSPTAVPRSFVMSFPRPVSARVLGLVAGLPIHLKTGSFKKKTPCLK